MAIPTRVMAGGNSAASAKAICGAVSTSLTAAGSSNTDALALSAEINIVTTTAASTGVKLMPAEAGSTITVANQGANALLVYPYSGAQIDALTATTGGFSVGAGKTAKFTGVSGTKWVSMLGA